MKLKNPNNTETNYQKLGNSTSPTLLLLHGIGADREMWEPQMQRYVEEGYHLLVPDLFGHGISSKLDKIELADWHNQINWLLEHEGIEKCILIGVSMGGAIAQSFVVDYPHKIEKIVISDSFGELRTSLEKLLGFLAILGFNLFKIFGKNWLAKGMRQNYKAQSARQAQEYFERVSLNVDLNQMILARKAIDRIDVLTQLKEVAIPALVLVGADSGQWFIDINRKITDTLPNSQFAIIEKSIDPSNLVNPTEFDRQVLEFIKRTSTPPFTKF